MKNDDPEHRRISNGLDTDTSLRYKLDALEKKLRWAQDSQALAIQVLTLLGQDLKSSDVIRQIFKSVKEFTGFEAVGIRLRDGEDFPYFETKGFSRDFIQLENSLCTRTETGEIIRDSVGNPFPDCMCGNIIRGRTDTSLPFFTQGGSFWTNSTTALLATTTEKERQSRTRNRCNGEGYESVALIPLRTDRQIIGILQLNDSRKNCFTLDMINFFEGIGVSIGIVLGRKRLKQERNQLFNLSLDMLCIAGFDGLFKQVNPAFTATLGWSAEELLEKPSIEFVHHEDREATIAAGRRMAAGEPLYQFENRYQHKDGSHRWISWNCFPVPGENLIFAVARDVTGQKQAEEALIAAKTKLERRVEERIASLIQLNEKLVLEIFERKRADAALRDSRQHYRSLFENMLEGFAYCKMIFEAGAPQDFVYLEVNKAFEKLTGLKNVIGKKVTDLVPGIKESNPEVFEIYGRVASTGSAEKFETYVDPLGIWFSISVYSPEREHFVAVFDNITERKRAEEEKENLSSQLLQAQKMEAVGALAGGVAHDFNNLLQVVLGYSELILGAEDTPGRYRDDLAKIHQAAQNGADLVQRLLTFSRKTESKPRPLNLNRRIEQVQKMLSRTIPKMIDIDLTLAQDLPAINADPTQMEQVVMNLAINARDAMPEGGRLIIKTENVILDEHYCKTHPEAMLGRHVLLSVSDTGKGMHKETMKHVFEPFFTTKGPGEGTGLGLAMVYGIVKQHSGHIVCHSVPGEGTTFDTYFPALVSEEEAKETTPRPPWRGGSETVLIVDDEELIRELCSTILTKAGYKAIAVSNGKEAVEAYQARKDEISLVILDLIMPTMGGRQCLERLLEFDPSVKVIIASGYSAEDETRAALASGAKGFVNKPYNIRQVLDVVRSVLDGAKDQGGQVAPEKQGPDR